ncbi:DUF4201 domain containing protein [Asbolus verrucosus]|uniref:DUF4201 domain containing protein n=1 Tax=Asbolus verrucosus TaxID=1661398 RepID=A0A482VU28_ASBVE|nr:DUF4201 domain containing protein [Asbolus verrucosus]
MPSDNANAEICVSTDDKSKTQSDTPENPDTSEQVEKPINSEDAANIKLDEQPEDLPNDDHIEQEEINEEPDADDTDISVKQGNVKESEGVEDEESENRKDKISDKEEDEIEEIKDTESKTVVDEENVTFKDQFDKETHKKLKNRESMEDFEALMKISQTDDSERDDILSFAASIAASQQSEKPFEHLQAEMEQNESIKGKQRRRKSGETFTSVASSEYIAPSVSDEKDLEEEEEEKEKKFDRFAYYEIYDQLTNQCQEEKIKNNYLQRKVVEYYKKRKMFHVLHEGKLTIDVQKKYEKQLDQLTDLVEYNTKEQSRLKTERTQLKCKLLSLENEAKALFEKFQSNELELGKEFEDTNTKGVTSEKIVERYLKRQKNQLAHIIKMRLDYIKMKNRYNEKMEALDALDNLGPDLHLIDYEQLKFDNRSLHDRLEERENELTKIRLKCQNAVQILAHVREKSSDVDININYLHERFQTVSNEYEDVREQLNSLKQERDMIRSSINKMKDKSGLLTKPKLLSDMESAAAEIMSLSKKLKKLKREHQSTTQIVDKMRKVMGSTKKLNKLKAKVEGKQVTSVTNSESTASSEFQFQFETSPANAY